MSYIDIFLILFVVIIGIAIVGAAIFVISVMILEYRRSLDHDRS